MYKQDAEPSALRQQHAEGEAGALGSCVATFGQLQEGCSAGHPPPALGMPRTHRHATHAQALGVGIRWHCSHLMYSIVHTCCLCCSVLVTQPWPSCNSPRLGAMADRKAFSGKIMGMKFMQRAEDKKKLEAAAIQQQQAAEAQLAELTVSVQAVLLLEQPASACKTVWHAADYRLRMSMAWVRTWPRCALRRAAVCAHTWRTMTQLL